MHAKFHLDPSNRLATIHQRHRQKDTHDRTGQLSDSIERTVLQTVAQKWTHYSTTSKSSGVPMISFLWPCYVIGQAIVFLPCIFFLLSFSSSSFFFSSPNLSGRIEIGCLPHFYTWCGLSANLECRSDLKRAARSSLEMQDPKNRHLGTIAQICRAISSQLGHVSTTGKKS